MYACIPSDITDAHTVGTAPLKLLRQCLRQLDLLKNVWLSVLPDAIYNKTFCDILNDFCNEIIRRILAMEDISATVANELSELIGVILEKVPSLFKVKRRSEFFVFFLYTYTTLLLLTVQI